MFKKIDKIKKYGVYDDFEWLHYFKAKDELKKLNIIYGRNYSGKTTLSRIARCIEKKMHHPNYSLGEFEITCEDSVKINSKNLTEVNYEVRVFNKDFISENLKVLLEDNGDIKPFAILGDKNITIDKKIKEIEAQLGDEETKESLKYNLKSARKDFDDSHKKQDQKEKELEKKLQDKARELKSDRSLRNINYNIGNIKEDIKTILSDNVSKLTSEELAAKTEGLKEEAKSSIAIQVTPILELEVRHDEVRKILETIVSSTQAIEDLVKDPSLQEWVRLGIMHHKSKRDDCAFCNSKIQESAWQRLESHFNKESETLRSRIKSEKALIDKHISNLEIGHIPSKENFYVQFQKQFEDQRDDHIGALGKYKKQLELLKDRLEDKDANVFESLQLEPLMSNSSELVTSFEKIQDLCRSNNKKTETLVNDQALLVKEVRQEIVRKFMEDIGYVDRVSEISQVTQDSISKMTLRDQLDTEIRQKQNEIVLLQSELKDEKKGASKVNEYLEHFFGHESLKLEATEGLEKNLLFKIKRNNLDAKNLSEGESSLIAFCYFMAKLKDVDTQGKEPIVWIDDPISSLDSNHIFFMFSLIESELARPINTGSGNKYRYKQLFISTHNLDFLKYLKRLSHPKIKNGENEEDDFEYFLLEREKDTTRIFHMPNHLKNYVTEFNYLFHQVYRCSSRSLGDEGTDKYYSFGNNLRKFLEIYLFYRYPGPANSAHKAKKFFGEGATSEILINRITNELSHLEGGLERGASPIDIAEISKVADFVLSKIEERDIDQFNELKKSIRV